MNVAIGGFGIESNSFSSEKATAADFEEWALTSRKDLIAVHKNDKNFLGGYIDAADNYGWNIIPLVFAYANPAGPVIQDFYESIKNSILNDLQNNHVDAVLLHLHGAAVADGYEDCEGDLLAAIRKTVGDEVPISVIYDLHGNISDMMVDNADISLGYKTQPHVDQYNLELEAAELIKKVLDNKISPVSIREQPPLLLPAIFTDTDRGPMKKIIDRAEEWETNENVIDVSPFPGFYGSDKKELGASVIVTTDNDEKLAKEIAHDMAKYIWDIKDEFIVPMVDVQDAIKRQRDEGGLYAFCDEADDPWGGAPADGTYILHALLNSGVKSAGVCYIHDPEIALKAWDIGIGGTIEGMLGSKVDGLNGSPVSIRAEVLTLFDEEFPLFYWDDEYMTTAGKVAVINERGIKIIVTEKKIGTENLDFFSILGMDIKDFDVIVIKGFGNAYQHVFKDVPKEYLTIDSIGITNPNVTKIGNYVNVRRPIYPLDNDVKFI